MNKKEWEKIKKEPITDSNFGNLFRLTLLISIPIIGSLTWWFLLIKYRFFMNYEEFKMRFE